MFGPLELIPLQQFRRLLEANLTGQLAVTQAFLPMLRQAARDGRVLYQDAFGRLVATFAAQHEQGSLPEVVAAAVAHALTTPRPRARYLVGKHAHGMAILAAALPTPVLDALRRRQAHQPAAGSRMPTPPATQAAVGGRTEPSRQQKAPLAARGVDE